MTEYNKERKEISIFDKIKITLGILFKYFQK